MQATHLKPFIGRRLLWILSLTALIASAAYGQCPGTMCADISVAKSVSGNQGRVSPLSGAGVLITVRNLGSADLAANAVRVIDVIPAGWGIGNISIRTLTGAPYCGLTGAPSCGTFGALDTGINLGAMAVNQGYSVNFSLTPLPTACPPQTLTNTATYAFNGAFTDPNPANNVGVGAALTASSALFGTVFSDRNGNGTVDFSAGDAGIADVPLTATEVNTGAIYTTMTGLFGSYTFFIPPGTYRIRRGSVKGFESGALNSVGGFVTGVPGSIAQSSPDTYANVPFNIRPDSACFATGFNFNFIVSETRPGEPGRVYPTETAPSDQRAGSVLIYPAYSSSAVNSSAENTRVSLTNIHPTASVSVHLFFVDGATCSVADSYLCLTPNQTSSFLISDVDPGTAGYIVAVTVDSTTGCPIVFNHLIGDEYVKFASGHAANLGAEAFAANPNSSSVCTPDSSTATLFFSTFTGVFTGGLNLNALPRVLAVDNLASSVDGNSTMLIVNRIAGNLATGASRLGAVFGLAFDDTETALSFSFSSNACQVRQILSDSFPRTAPRLSTLIPAGRSGWMKFWSNGTGASGDNTSPGILGAAINFNATAAANSNAFNQGHNLHVLRTTTSATLILPVFPPSCN